MEAAILPKRHDVKSVTCNECGKEVDYYCVTYTDDKVKLTATCHEEESDCDITDFPFVTGYVLWCEKK